MRRYTVTCHIGRLTINKQTTPGYYRETVKAPNPEAAVAQVLKMAYRDHVYLAPDDLVEVQQV